MKLPHASWILWPETQSLIAAFGNTPLRFIGGAVRDSLLGIAVKDIDVATPLPPEDVMELLKKSDIKVIPTGINHGTVTAVINKRPFEITTLRRDVATDGRRAVVAYTEDWREDATRRDFTMNALYADAQGEITDYFNGIEDAKMGRVRFIGNAEERILEDALRILRFFRFFVLYGKGDANKDALTACAKLASKIDNLSGERIQQEMLKLLAAPKSAEVIELMQEHGVLRHIIPAQISTDSLKKLPEIVQKTTLSKDPILALALLLRSTKKIASLIEKIAERWKLSKANHYRLLDLCKSPRLIKTGADAKLWKKWIREVGKDLFITQVIVNIAEGADIETGISAIELAKAWSVPAFPITGDDLIKHGITPGKTMGETLKRLESHWEESGYASTQEELLKLVSLH